MQAERKVQERAPRQSPLRSGEVCMELI
jgi:hypothetical protein